MVVLNGKIVGRGYNLRTKLQMATAHAEVRAIEQACKKLKSWRLPEAEIYVTLEPCPMCMGPRTSLYILPRSSALPPRGSP